MISLGPEGGDAGSTLTRVHQERDKCRKVRQLNPSGRGHQRRISTRKKKNVVLLRALNISLLESGLTELQVQVQTGLEQRGDMAALPGNIPAKSITWKLLTGGITGAHWAE